MIRRWWCVRLIFHKINFNVLRPNYNIFYSKKNLLNNRRHAALTINYVFRTTRWILRICQFFPAYNEIVANVNDLAMRFGVGFAGIGEYSNPLLPALPRILTPPKSCLFWFRLPRFLFIVYGKEPRPGAHTKKSADPKGPTDFLVGWAGIHPSLKLRSTRVGHLTLFSSS